MKTIQEAVVKGGIGFGVVSFCVFATVAFSERWMYSHLGVLGAYLTWTILFIVLGGGILGTLVTGRWALPKFYLVFAIAFFAYAFGWVAAYFILRGKTGQRAGSLIGSILMALVFAAGFRATKVLAKLAAILFVTNSIGYFLGSALNESIGGQTGMLVWGVSYGVFLGVGIGAALQISESSSQS